MEFIILFLIFLGAVYVVYFFIRAPYRMFTMKKFAHRMGLQYVKKYEKRERSLTTTLNDEYTKYKVIGVYKGKKIAVYDVYYNITPFLIPNLWLLRRGHTEIYVNGKNIYSPFFLRVFTFLSARKIGSIITEFPGLREG